MLEESMQSPTANLAIEQPVTDRPDVLPVSRAAFWFGWALSGLAGAFLLMDGGMKLAPPEFVVKATTDLGYPAHVVVPLGIVLTLSTLLYLIPRTAVLGAILLTGYLGGAVATHVRVGNPLFSHVLAPCYFGVLIWGGLLLRDRRIRKLLPFRRIGHR